MGFIVPEEEPVVSAFTVPDEEDVVEVHSVQASSDRLQCTSRFPVFECLRMKMERLLVFDKLTDSNFSPAARLQDHEIVTSVVRSLFRCQDSIESEDLPDRVRAAINHLRVLFSAEVLDLGYDQIAGWKGSTLNMNCAILEFIAAAELEDPGFWHWPERTSSGSKKHDWSVIELAAREKVFRPEEFKRMADMHMLNALMGEWGPHEVHGQLPNQDALADLLTSLRLGTQATGASVFQGADYLVAFTTFQVILQRSTLPTSQFISTIGISIVLADHHPKEKEHGAKVRGGRTLSRSIS
ncbi:hypothetical protein AMS68_002108 [Peltaster fructicola]|uniref:Uncharacterized protein n=1 Tax=Peltaster fructicola TaxID=286661 RepID=A0A6H0XPL3_9PEZI|nr:hypothetical protein AMS68_002108 [Peltaster fructicola]